MDRQVVFVMALLEVVLERERQKKRLMEESLRAQIVALQEKRRKHSVLVRKKKRMLEKQAAEKKLVDDFMVLVGAMENNDLETAQNFDAKAMMNTIATMMNTNGRDGEVFASDYGDNKVSEINLDLQEQAMMDAIVALVNSVGSCGGDNGGFSDDHALGGTKNAPEKTQNLGEEAMAAVIGETKCDGSEVSNAGGHGGSCGGDDGGFAGYHGLGGTNNAPDNTQNLGEEATMAAIEGTKSDGSEVSNAGGNGSIGGKGSK